MSNGPIFYRTRFGYIVSGPVPHPPETSDHSNISLFACLNNELENLEKKMAAFTPRSDIGDQRTFTQRMNM